MATQTHTFVTASGAVRVKDLTEAALAMNIKAIVDADAAIAEAKVKREQAVDALTKTHGNGKHTVPGFGSVTLSANNVYSEDAMVAALTPYQFQRQASKRVLDRAKVKANFPAVYEAAREQRGVRASATLF